MRFLNLPTLELINSIVEQLYEIESDLGLPRKHIIDSTRPEIRRITEELQSAVLQIGYYSLKAELRSCGYSVHRLGAPSEDVVIHDYHGVIETIKGKLIF